MNAKDIAKRLGISRKWLDNFAKAKHAELGNSERFLDWEKYIPEIKEKWAKKTHKQYVAKQYIKLSLCYGTVGYYKPEDLEIIKKYSELFIQLKKSAFDILKLRNSIIEEYASISKANSENLKALSDFLLKELAYQDCLTNYSKFTRVNLKSLDFTNYISIEEMKKCVAEKKYPCEEIYEYGRRILEIRKKYHIEVAAKKTTDTSYDDNFGFNVTDFNYKNPQSIIETLKKLQGEKEIEGFYNSFMDFLKIKYGLLHRDFESLSKDYKNCDLTELKKEIEEKIAEKNDSIDLSFKELSHAYDDFRPKQESLDRQLKETNYALKGYRQDIKNKRSEIQNKSAEKKNAFKTKSDLRNALDKRKAEIYSLSPEGKRAHISDDSIVIDIMEKIRLAIAEHKSLVNEEKLLVKEKNDIKSEKERSADNKKNIKERIDLLDFEKDKTIYLRENIDFLLKELKSYKKTLEEIDLIMEKEKELKRFETMIKELDSSWLYNSQDYNETIELLAKKEKEKKDEARRSEEDIKILEEIRDVDPITEEELKEIEEIEKLMEDEWI
ncbi:MAG: hypothetical protein J6I53_04990 [Treponema sp.]|nr:hypothetical protein [Treponema sp.]